MRGAAVGSYPLGLSGLGAAVSVCVSTFRASLPGAAGQTAQEEDDRVGLAQLLLLVRRWHPEREIVAVADGGYASLKLLLDRCRSLGNPITFITRLRLDAALSL